MKKIPKVVDNALQEKRTLCNRILQFCYIIVIKV